MPSSNNGLATESDPFVYHGVTEDPVVRPWNPFIGAFAAETTPPTR